MVGDRPRGSLIAFLVVALCATIGEGVVAVVLSGFDWLLGELSAWGVVVAVASVIGAGCCIAGLVGLGRPGPTAVALGGVLGAQLVVSAFLATRVADLWSGLGHEGFEGAHGFVLGAVLAGAAALAVAAAWFLRPPARVLAGALAGIVLLGGAASAVAAVGVEVTGADCDRFRFDPQRWAAAPQDRRAPIARGLVECGGLGADTRAAVRARLGRPGLEGRHQDLWTVGDPGAWIPTTLTVDYTRDGRVTSLRLNGD